MSSAKRAYSYDEIVEILGDYFDHYVLTGVSSVVTEDGVSKNNTFLAREGNLSCCYGLSVQASKEIQKHIDVLSFVDESDLFGGDSNEEN